MTAGRYLLCCSSLEESNLESEVWTVSGGSMIRSKICFLEVCASWQHTVQTANSATDDGGFKSNNPTPLLDIGSSRSPPVAAIAGGVFGGAAVVVLVLARLWFWHRRWWPSAVEVVGIDVGVHGYSCGRLDANGTPKTELATRETHNSVTGWEAEAAGIPMPGMAARDALAFGCPGGAEMGSSAKGVGLLPRQSAERLAELEAPLQLQEMNS